MSDSSTASRSCSRPGLGDGHRSWCGAHDDRRRLDDLRGARQEEEGAAYGYTKVLGYHPLLATRAETGEVLHVRFRKGSAGSGRGAQRFVRELVGRVRRCGATGPLTLRADAGFYSGKVMKA